MPNWCNNYLTVTGPAESLEVFKKVSKDHNKSLLSLEAFIPLGDDLDAYNMWGTKWDIYEINLLSERDEFVNYFFETANSPPEVAFETISGQHPNLSFNLQYYEEGNDFIGYCICEKGIKVQSANDSYSKRTSAHLELKNVDFDFLNDQIILKIEKGLYENENMFDFNSQMKYNDFFERFPGNLFENDGLFEKRLLSVVDNECFGLFCYDESEMDSMRDFENLFRLLKDSQESILKSLEMLKLKHSLDKNLIKAEENIKILKKV